MISSSHALTSNDNLGRFIAAYQATRIRQEGNLWGGIVFIVLGLVALGFGWMAATSATAVALFWSSVGLLCLAGGVWAVYAHRQGQDQLAQIIQQEVTDQQLPRAIADFNAGVPLRFGPLMVTPEGIEHGRQLLPWSEFGKFATSRHGHFVVHAQQGVTSWARVDMVKMTNIFTLLALVDRIVRR